VERTVQRWRQRQRDQRGWRSGRRLEGDLCAADRRDCERECPW
jgi:hypothetical protein